MQEILEFGHRPQVAVLKQRQRPDRSGKCHKRGPQSGPLLRFNAEDLIPVGRVGLVM